MFQPFYKEWYTFLDSGEKSPILYDHAFNNFRIAENIAHKYVEECRLEIIRVMLNICKNLLSDLIKEKINIALIQMKSK